MFAKMNNNYFNRDQQNCTISYERLNEIIGKFSREPNNLLVRLQKEDTFINLLIDDNKLKERYESYSFFRLSYKAIAIICDCDARHLNSFMIEVCDTSFDIPIQNYLRNFGKFLIPKIAYRDDKHLEIVKRHIEAFGNIIKFVRKLQIAKLCDDRVNRIFLSLSFAMKLFGEFETLIEESTVSEFNIIESECKKSRSLLNYLINPSNEIKILSYLNHKTDYDLTHFTELSNTKESEKFCTNNNFIDMEFSLTGLIDFNRQTRLENVYILDDRSWPKHDLFGLDEWQYKAFKAALTKQMVIIRGASGTEKTYVMQRIVQTLLRNRIYCQTEPKPISIVCYTERILNRTLERIAQFCNNGILRIGEHIDSNVIQIEKINFLEINQITDKQYLNKIREFDIIGLTTNDAAIYRSFIEQIDPSVVIIEEAAEMFDYQVITCLTKSTNHLILISDHQQLIPHPNVYNLAPNATLFERLMNSGMNYYQLKLQHRMRPSISSLLVPHFYDELRDYYSVEKFKNIKGICENVFFVNHNRIESYSDLNTDVNSFEGKFVVQISEYLVQQSYKLSQITILVTNTSQLNEVKKYLKEYESIQNGVKVSLIDNFRGQENDIILVSFANSNAEGKVDFLNISSRIYVALSRAKQGLYCIGNFDYLAQQNYLWNNIRKVLKEKKLIAPYLEIYCQNERKHKIKILKASEFQLFNKIGCTKRCERKLSCGHKCADLCSKTCDALKCKEIIKTTLKCSHFYNIKCSEKNDTEKLSNVICIELCEIKLDCGCKCIGQCGRCKKNGHHFRCRKHCEYRQMKSGKRSYPSNGKRARTER